LAASVAPMQGTQIDNYQSLDQAQLIRDIQGRHVLIVAHGFNVTRADGIAALSNWEALLQLAPPAVFVGVLWPGDSIWLHGLDYPGEPQVADDAGRQLIAPFLDAHFGSAASISFASHSLGARVILQTIAAMSLPVRRAVLMAGAIDDNCLNTDFQAATAKIGEISILASKEDEVLSLAFPLGNFFAGILDAGHPWWHSALGRSGPSNPPPVNFQAPFLIPDDWEFGHGSYLQVDPPAPPPPPFLVPLPACVPPQDTLPPANGEPGWQQSWSAAFVSTRNNSPT
jgi:hypothetical protein